MLKLPTLSPRARKILLRVFAVMTAVYFVFGVSIWWAMRQPPETFGRVMAKMPGPIVFLAFPFETLWTQARAGSLHVGDPAPDFSLIKPDKSESIRLSSLNRQGPVVLVFGSYT
jgi:hypothetical protein